jgi:hypothetical protein
MLINSLTQFHKFTEVEEVFLLIFKTITFT